MKNANEKKQKRERRHKRIRAKVKGDAERPRLAVFRSNKYLYAQLIDDKEGKTLCEANTLKGKKGSKKIEMAKEVGKEIAKKALGLKIKKAVFDRAGFIFAGKVKAIADGAREGGLEF